MIRVCYFGTYDLDQSRNIVMIKGLSENGIEVIRCRADLWRGTADKIQAIKIGLLNPGLLCRIWRSYVGALRRYAQVGDYDVMIVGYPGYLDVFPAKILASLAGKPLIFDAFISLTEAAIEDRVLVQPNSLTARLLRLLDRYSCGLADLVLTDTDAPIQHSCEDIGVNPGKLRRAYAGADGIYAGPSAQVRKDDSFQVLYFGAYIPLHGVNYIVEAAKILEHVSDIQFELVGREETYDQVVALAERLRVSNVTFHHVWLSAEALMADHILPADLCLGIFGDTPMAKRAVPTKVYVALAAGKPVITGDSPAAREVLVHGRDALLCEMRNPRALAQAILLLRRDRSLQERIAGEGHKSFLRRFSPGAIGATVKDFLTEIM